MTGAQVRKRRATLTRYDKIIFVVSLCLVGYFGQWWMIVVPSALLGASRSQCRGLIGAAALWAGLTWMAFAGFHDAFTGARLSARLAEVMHLSWRPVLYLFTGCLAGVLAGIAAESGRLGARLIFYRSLVASEPVPPGK